MRTTQAAVHSRLVFDDMAIIHVDSNHANVWAELCHELWPHHTANQMLDEFHRGELPNEYLYFIDDEPVGFMSLSIRTDYVEGKTGTGPVGYLEAIYVRPPYRKQGIAKDLLKSAKKWAFEQGCAMLASDCALTNTGSRLFHQRIGFHEVSVNIHFTMNLTV